MSLRDRSSTRYRAIAGGLCDEAPAGANEAEARRGFECWAADTGWRGPGWERLDERERNWWRARAGS